jgi:hypothetical protein
MVVKLVVIKGCLKKLFNHGKDRFSFQVRDIAEKRIQKATKEIWPQCYGKSALLHSKLLRVKFCKRMDAKLVYKMDVN